MEIAWWVFTLSGLAVGFIVGMTGVGGGSLMTPILIALGVPAVKAVATDLLYAAITKSGGIWAHQKNKTIDWSITGWLALGSVPASILTLIVLAYFGLNGVDKNSENLIKLVLGFALFLTAIAMLFKHKFQHFKKPQPVDVGHHHAHKIALATVITGIVLGVLVTISSIGAGAVGTIVLFSLYPLIPTNRIVGTDIAHAVPLTAIAGIAHAVMGQDPIHWGMLGFLLMGSLPGIYVGSQLGGKVPDKVLRPALAAMLFIIGLTMVVPLLK